MDLKSLPLEYHRSELKIEDLNKNPLTQMQEWMEYALKNNITYFHAANLATVCEQGWPSNRIVLIKEVNAIGPIFFTNYASRKGQELASNNRVAISLFWKELDRQVNLIGRTSKLSTYDSEEYFHSRPRASQISALASHQSHEVSKEELEAKVQEIEKKYLNSEIPFPANWGGYQVSVEQIEFWQGRPNRLHDRFLYRKQNGEWKVDRLAP